jgi:small GTP-binding protein
MAESIPSGLDVRSDSKSERAVVQPLKIQKESMSSHRFKVVLMGPSSVGKTSIVIRFSMGTFSPDQEPTIGAAFISRDVDSDHGIVSLHVWDTAGQERYRSLVPKYSEGAAAILIVFDVTDPDSFEEAKELYAESKERHRLGMIWFLVANKCDLPATVDNDLVRDFAASESIHLIETSAKTGQNIHLLFNQVAHYMPDMLPPDRVVVDVEAREQSRLDENCC